jgi:hypothetical protein
MKNIKKVLRILGLVLLIVLASSGMGMITIREPYKDKEIQTEQVDKKEEDETDETGTQKN